MIHRSPRVCKTADEPVKRGVVASSTEHSKQLDPGGDVETVTFLPGAAVLCAVYSVLSVSVSHFFLVFKCCQAQKQEFPVEDEIDWDARARWMKSSFPRLNWPRVI